MASPLLNYDEKNGPMLDSFRLLEKVGQGLLVAIKQVPIDTDLDTLMHEIAVLDACNSPSIVALYGFFIEHKKLSIVMEYCEAGSVSDITKKLGEPLMEHHIASLMRDALLGLEYLHVRSKIHRDIKAGNILVDALGRGKLADFGVAGQLSDASSKRNTVIGTPYWMAPEVIQEVGYTTKADIWSLGITCIEMAEGHPPFHHIHPMRAIFMIPNRPPPTLSSYEKWSSDMHHFVSSCLTSNPDDRPSATDLLTHAPFVQSPNVHSMHQLIQQVLQLTENPPSRDTEERDETMMPLRAVPKLPQAQRRPSASSVHSNHSIPLSDLESPLSSPMMMVMAGPPPERPERSQHRRLGSFSGGSRRPSGEPSAGPGSIQPMTPPLLPIGLHHGLHPTTPPPPPPSASYATTPSSSSSSSPQVAVLVASHGKWRRSPRHAPPSSLGRKFRSPCTTAQPPVLSKHHRVRSTRRFATPST